MTTAKKRYKLSMAEAQAAAAEILSRGRDVEMRSVNNGKSVIVYELKKNKVHTKEPDTENRI